LKAYVAVLIDQAIHTGSTREVAKKANRAVVVAAAGFWARLIGGGAVFLANTGIANFADFAVCIHETVT
jgi:hypothetical protein